MYDAAVIEERLRARSLPGLEGALIGTGWVMPNYEGLGIANLPATIAALFGRELPGACPPLERELWVRWREGLRRIVLVLIDALGYLQLCEAMDACADLVLHRLAEAGTLVPITSTFPSTTNTVLSTLWTGRCPAEHGVLAYELYLRELGVAASTLFFWPIHHRRRDELAEWGVEPKTFLPVPSLAEQLSAQGILTRAFIRKAYTDSILSQIHNRGVREVIPFVSAGDVWTGARRIIEEHPLDKMLLTVYWDTIDGVTHRNSPDDEAWLLELRGIGWMFEQAFLSRLTAAQRDGTLLLVVADHGGITTLPGDAVRLEDHPALRDALALPPVGESRAPFLHTRGDSLAEVQAYMREELAEYFVTLTRDQVLASGLLGQGPVYAETPHRLGDVIGLARGRHYLARTQNQLKMLGRHGGLTAREMLVPLLGVRLDWM